METQNSRADSKDKGSSSQDKAYYMIQKVNYLIFIQMKCNMHMRRLACGNSICDLPCFKSAKICLVGDWIDKTCYIYEM